jgi:hypothetical protein
VSKAIPPLGLFTISFLPEKVKKDAVMIFNATNYTLTYQPGENANPKTGLPTSNLLKGNAK